MRQQIPVSQTTLESKKFGTYDVVFVKPAAATVELVTYTAEPTLAIYHTTKAYKGLYTTNLDEEYGIKDSLTDVVNTKLQTPLEMVHMLWLLKDVTRAFTHQLVRYRVGTAFVQESMRFLGMKGMFKILITDKANNREYKAAGIAAVKNYVEQIENGVPSEDARGILPTNILTNIYFDCSLRTLQGIFPQRLCCQAQQGEWQPILREMRQQIGTKMGRQVEDLLLAPYERGVPCGYRASFDRKCVWQEEN
jgi:thymidylate synthase (FAD)